MSQGAISSLVFSSGTVITASASMGHIFGQPIIPKKCRKSTQLSFSSSMSYSSSSTITNVSPKSPLKRFKLFRSKNKRSKISSSTYIVPPKTIHPRLINPNQIVEVEDDDISSVCSDATSVFIMKDRDRKTLSTPNLPTAIQQSKNYWNNWNNSPTFVPHSSVSEIVLEEEEDEEDWDTHSDSGYNKAAGTSSPSLPILNGSPPKRHSRCKSLPPNIQDYSPSLYHRQPTPSEIWDEDEDFDLDDTNEINVPTSVEETQVSLRMDISNIRDFVTQIGELKVLRDDKEKFTSIMKSKMTKKWKSSFLRTNKIKSLENLYKKDWEEAIVIIDIAEYAQNNEMDDEQENHVEVDIERIPSKHHMKIFKKIVTDGLGEDAKDLALFDDDKENKENKENHYKSITKKMSFRLNDDNDPYNSRSKKRRKEKLRISVEVMPSLVDHLRKLQTRLNNHVKELGRLAQDDAI